MSGRRRAPAPPVPTGLAGRGALRRLLLPLLVLVLGWGLAGPTPAAAQAAPAGSDSALEGARGLLDAQRPLSAARLLARALSEGRVAGAEALLLAARAHAAYGAWGAVDRLLEGQPWLDELAGAEGRLLLARARLETGDPAGAVRAFERLADAAAAGRPQAAVGHAAALMAAERPRAAARVLLAAAARHPELAAWLRFDALRALAEEGDTAAAGRLAPALLAEPALPADSVRGLRALAAFRAGDAAGGVRLARGVGGALGAALDGEWVGPALLAAGDTAEATAAFRRALVAAAPPEAVGAALLALDPGWAVHAEVAAADRRSGRPARARAALEAALERAPAAERPGLAERLAALRAAAGDHAGALEALEPWLEDPAVEPERRAALWLAASRGLGALGRAEAAEEALARAAEVGAAAGSAAGTPGFAAFLLADRRHDRGETEAAREAYEGVVERFGGTRYAELALSRLGMLALAAGRPAEAVARFDDYRRRYPNGEWVQGALYWSGRARQVTGEEEAARTLYRRALRQDPLGYYGMRGAERLGADAWVEAAPREAPEPALDAASARLLARMEALRAVGWTDRARAELRAAPRPPGGEAGRLAMALALNRAGWTAEGVARGHAVRARRGTWTLPLLRAVYPLIYAPALRAAAADRGLPPALVAAVARRESMFDREIVSAAGAVGLLQLMPATAESVAAREALADFRLPQLAVPEVNLRLGTRYLADMLDRFGGSRVAALVAYNAGPHRWLAWRGYPETGGDEEAFVERIPFRETRDYVRAVLALERLYARLYASELAGAGAGPGG